MAYKNPEDAKAWRERNKEKLKADGKAWRAKHKERIAAKDKERWQKLKNDPVYKANKKIKAREWRLKVKDTPDFKAKRTLNQTRYLQRKEDNDYIITELDKLVEHELYDLAQRRTIQTGFKWHVDHIQPLTKGGKHAIENLQVVPGIWNETKGNRNNDVYKVAA
jgi:phytoene dehydrogenase-like protein